MAPDRGRHGSQRAGSWSPPTAQGALHPSWGPGSPMARPGGHRGPSGLIYSRRHRTPCEMTRKTSMQHRVHGDGDQTGPACIFDDRHWGRDLSRASLWERVVLCNGTGWLTTTSCVPDEIALTCILAYGRRGRIRVLSVSSSPPRCRAAHDNGILVWFRSGGVAKGGRQTGRPPGLRLHARNPTQPVLQNAHQHACRHQLQDAGSGRAGTPSF